MRLTHETCSTASLLASSYWLGWRFMTQFCRFNPWSWPLLHPWSCKLGLPEVVLFQYRLWKYIFGILGFLLRHQDRHTWSLGSLDQQQQTIDWQRPSLRGYYRLLRQYSRDTCLHHWSIRALESLKSRIGCIRSSATSSSLPVTDSKKLCSNDGLLFEWGSQRTEKDQPRDRKAAQERQKRCQERTQATPSR